MQERANPKFIYTIGLQGSGKTTFAQAWVAENPDERTRVNRDDLRKMMHGGYNDRAEAAVRRVRNLIIKDALWDQRDVICDDTNLEPTTIAKLLKLARATGADLFLADFTHVPLSVCVMRDANRENPVGEQVIRGTLDRHIHQFGPEILTMQVDDFIDREVELIRVKGQQ